MKTEKIKLSELTEWKNNSRIHTQRNLLTIKNSLETFGQTKPLIVQKSSMSIIAGNGTYQAMKALGWEEAYCYVIDIDDNKAEAYCIVDNRATDQSQWDQKILLDRLSFLQEEDEELLNATGYDSTEIEKMFEFLDGEAFNLPEEPKEKKKKEKTNEVDYSADTDGQASFILMGCPFVTRDENKILELKGFLQYFADDVQESRDIVAEKVFNSIEETLREHYYGGNK